MMEIDWYSCIFHCLEPDFPTNSDSSLTRKINSMSKSRKMMSTRKITHSRRTLVRKILKENRNLLAINRPHFERYNLVRRINSTRKITVDSRTMISKDSRTRKIPFERSLSFEPNPYLSNNRSRKIHQYEGS